MDCSQVGTSYLSCTRQSLLLACLAHYCLAEIISCYLLGSCNVTLFG